MDRTCAYCGGDSAGKYCTAKCKRLDAQKFEQDWTPAYKKR